MSSTQGRKRKYAEFDEGFGSNRTSLIRPGDVADKRNRMERQWKLGDLFEASQANPQDALWISGEQAGGESCSDTEMQDDEDIPDSRLNDAGHSRIADFTNTTDARTLLFGSAITVADLHGGGLEIPVSDADTKSQTTATVVPEDQCPGSSNYSASAVPNADTPDDGSGWASHIGPDGQVVRRRVSVDSLPGSDAASEYSTRSLISIQSYGVNNPLDNTLFASMGGLGLDDAGGAVWSSTLELSEDEEQSDRNPTGKDC
jgi:hypothetical protein